MATIIDGGFNPYNYKFYEGSTSVLNNYVEWCNSFANERIERDSFTTFYNLTQTGLFKILYPNSQSGFYRVTSIGSLGSIKGPYPDYTLMTGGEELGYMSDELRVMYVKLWGKSELQNIKYSVSNRYVYELEYDTSYGFSKTSTGLSTQSMKCKILKKHNIGVDVSQTIIDSLDDDEVCVFEIDSLDNDNDGSYSQDNPRNKRTSPVWDRIRSDEQHLYTVLATPLMVGRDNITSGYPLYIAMEIDSMWRCRLDAMNYFNFTYRSPVHQDSSRKNTPSNIGIGNMLGCLCGYLPYKLKVFHVSSTDFGEEGEIVDIENPNFIFWKKDDLTDFLNKISMPWTYSYDEFLYKNSNEFTDFKPEGGGGEKGEGQPENQINTGGGGDGDNSSDVFLSPNPSITSINGLNGNYAMSMSQLKSFKEYLWTQDFLDAINPFNSEPSKNIVGVTMYPFDIVNHDSTHTAQTTQIVVGNVEIEKSAYLIDSAYRCVLNLGSLKLNEYYGNFLDYGSFTKLQLYIPYSGFTELSPNDVMGKTISVTMSIDLVSGSGVTMVYADNVIYKIIPVSLGVNLPLSSSNETGNGLKFATNLISGIGSVYSGNIGGAVSSAVSIANQSVDVDKGSAQSPFANWYMPQDCYLIITRPKYSEPPYYNEIKGKPSFWGGQLKDCDGFTVVDNPIVDNIPCTESERALIVSYLQKGIRI